MRSDSMTGTRTGVKSYKSGGESSAERALTEQLKHCPVPDDQLLENLGLFLTAKNLSRILFMHHVYQLIIDIPGIVMDFGTRWGQNLALFSTFRGIYEPFNRHRRVVGFDTFSGFPGIARQDGASDLMAVGNISVTPGYVEYLRRALGCHEQLNPLAHIQKFEVVEGDAVTTVPDYLKGHPETIVALAYFDFDLYEPTRRCLEAIRDRLVPGSVLGFDELNDHDSPGETLAVMETLGLNRVALRRFRYASRASYFIVQ